MKGEFGSLWVWRDSRVKDRLSWYYSVATNSMPAKYLICKRVPVDPSVFSMDIDGLWKEYEHSLTRFLALWDDVRRGRVKISDMQVVEPNILDLLLAIVKGSLRACNFCRWQCRVDRLSGGKLGACKLEAESRVSTFFHHQGEEMVFRGSKGSGTIFFTSCNMRCAFCQNSDISTDRFNGSIATPYMIALMAYKLRLEGCHNINWVGGEPTIHLHSIVEAIREMSRFSIKRASGIGKDLFMIKPMNADMPYEYAMNASNAYHGDEFNAPQLWNSNFFMSREALNILRCIMDVWLPDLKFGSNRCALRLARTPWYWETVTSNIKQIHEWHEDTVIRHLIMPGHVECCTKPVLEWVAGNMPEVLINIMDQYRPENYCDPCSPNYDPAYRDMARFPSDEEIYEAYRYARSLNLNFEIITFEKRIS
ncbi:MAG: radical SAM protein [Candidatus Nitrosocaldus sp.]|nr:radical SAM protein [Candidatus Nitrosocaldus sp.]MDW7999520.1 radical SAM protein [Candidatus Nitrosocaldus sp.]